MDGIMTVSSLVEAQAGYFVARRRAAVQMHSVH